MLALGQTVVTASCDDAEGGGIAPSGLYMAEANADTLHIEMNRDDWTVDCVTDGRGHQLAGKMGQRGALNFRAGTLMRQGENTLSVALHPNLGDDQRVFIITLSVPPGFLREEIIVRQQQAADSLAADSLPPPPPGLFPPPYEPF